MPTKDELTTVSHAQEWCAAHIDKCPRSLEWKHGARAGCFKAYGLEAQSSPWVSGTAQDDARNAGFQYGYAQAKPDVQTGAPA